LDRLLNIAHGGTGIIVTNSKLHDRWKASLVGHYDSNEVEAVAIIVSSRRFFYEIEVGYAVARGNDCGNLDNIASVGTFGPAPYTYRLIAASAVKVAVTASAGQILTF